MEIFRISLTEWVGYIASVGVLISFLMRNIRTLRIINSFGCIFFVVYGVLLDSIPVIVTNTVIVGINLYYLLIKRR
ncbi:uroporphyrinogen decarboxylase [Leptobacterium sp. I13]|uniref:uroporphyrinogen decarboxylase n=1 Tax=Leptobacterium meishanense TaxID=3128904 RepID=UPI0030ECFDB0